jgi:hypothetical protein
MIAKDHQSGSKLTRYHKIYNVNQTKNIEKWEERTKIKINEEYKMIKLIWLLLFFFSYIKLMFYKSFILYFSMLVFNKKIKDITTFNSEYFIICIIVFNLNQKTFHTLFIIF